MLVVVVATVGASAAGTCRPVVVKAGAGMAAVAVNTGAGGWSRLSRLGLGGLSDRQRWDWAWLPLSSTLVMVVVP